MTRNEVPHAERGLILKTYDSENSGVAVDVCFETDNIIIQPWGKYYVTFIWKQNEGAWGRHHSQEITALRNG